MIEIDGVELRTAAQWEKKHRHVKKGQLGKGVERTWRSPNGNTTAMFYNIEQTRPWAKKDVEAVNRRRRADAKAKREAEERERSEGAARAEQHRKDLLDCWGAHIDEETLQEGRRDHTAYQWCDLGFVPIAEARWRLTRYGGNSAWYYCSPWDVRYDPDRASHGIPNCVWPCKGAALDPLGRSPRDPPALLIRGVAHEVRAIGASAE